MESWKNPLSNTNLSISVLTKMLPTKGNLVYEYNPFRNFRLSKDMYEYNGILYSEEELEEKFQITLDESQEYWKRNGQKIYETSEEVPSLRLKGELVDFITDQLSFDLEHPVNIIPQYSYDGSVNLILNDGINQPRLINSRFSATGKDTYEIVDRAGSNDTNIYDQGEQFDTDTSLYKRVKQIPKLTLKSVSSGGSLKCGNYHFYFKLSDADGNETDFIAESGLVSVFIGDYSPNSCYTGNRNENSVKQVIFELTNIDPSYNYVSTYYSRSTAEDGENRIVEYKKIDRNYIVSNTGESLIIVTGFDEEIDITSEEINLTYNIVDAANCAATAQSMLFLGNVHKPNIPYQELQDLSLRFLPYLKDERYQLDIDEEYNISSTNKGYYDPLYIYNKVGYWNNELYRFGIVYILSNGELSPVFNIRGRENIGYFNAGGNAEKSFYDNQYNYYKVFNEDKKDRITIKYNENSNIIIPPNSEEGIPSSVARAGNGDILSSPGIFENTKGIISLNSPKEDKTVHSIEIRVDPDVQIALKNLGIKGYFFVRQNRMPTILAQGITIGIDKEGRLPTIPTKEGVLSELSSELGKNTYVETSDINSTNFISEGFLTRYTFGIKKKKSAIWASVGKVTAIAAAVVAIAAVSIVTFGGGLVAAGGALAILGAASATAGSIVGASALTGALIVGAAVGAVAGAAGAALVAGFDDVIVNSVARTARPKKLKGRKTEITKGYKRVEDETSRRLGGSFRDRIIIKDPSKNGIEGILCPDYDVAPQYYNQLFTGGEFVVKTTKNQPYNQYTPTILFYDYEDPDSYDNDTFNIRKQQLLQEGRITEAFTFINDGRHFYMPFSGYSDQNVVNTYTCRLQAVPDDVACVTLGKLKFRSKAGNSEEAWRYECIGDDFKQIPTYSSKEEGIEQSSDAEQLTEEQIKQEQEDKEINADIVRGSYGPYIGMDGYYGRAGETINIMIPGYAEGLLGQYINMRMQDISPFYAVSDRIDISNLQEYYLNQSNLQGDVSLDNTCKFEIYRGDCYICQFTHRLNRNFNDPNSPYNSDIVDSNSWKDHYKTQKSEEFEKINLGDVNAVNLGMWVTFTVRSNRNLNVRSLDGSVISEAVQMGHPRGFFPYHGMIAEGNYKSPEALVYNDGFSKNLGDRFNFTLPDSPFIKNWFGTRIMYSDIHINDGYKNGYRVFQGQNYRDYTRQYGSIVKLLNYKDNLFVVFEHGLAIIPVNERAVAAQGAGGTVFINTENVLPEHPNIISESYGSLWPDSVIVTAQDGVEEPRIFGVDTCAKKIWMFDGHLKIISDFKVQEFLNNNLTLSEREKTPLLGLRNVKTAYNAFKHDVMFTFYDDMSGVEEKVWNLCYNTLLDKFITFYSWIPSFMENINNIPFSFDRNVSKWIAKLGQTHADNSFAEGIVLSNNIYNNDGSTDSIPYINYRYLNKNGGYSEAKVTSFKNVDSNGLIGIFNLMNHILPEGDNIEYFIKFDLIRDIYGYWKNFEVRQVGTFATNELPDAKDVNSEIPVYGLYFKSKNDVSSEDSKAVINSSGDIYISSNGKDLHFSELFYRNKEGITYNDFEDNMVTAEEIDSMHCMVDPDTKLTLKNYFQQVQSRNLPVFHGRDGIRASLPKSINKQNIIQLLNIRATIYARFIGNQDSPTYNQSLAEFMNYVKAKESGSRERIVESQEGWFNAGIYESSIAITSKWNLQFLTSDFWKHGQAGVIDIAEDIKPTKWYGEQHPFEFECIVVNDPGIHKIFQNLEIISNKAQPESFHFEVIGEAYDFAKDKPNMYFRQEARKALFQYNGCDITYNRNFLKINPKQQAKSAELVHQYYERQDTLEDVYDNYLLKEDPIKNSLITSTYYNAWASMTPNKDYCHLSGAEIVYYPNRQEYRIWQHQPAINIDDLPQDLSSSIIRGNCQYLEDRWRVSINPLLVCYKNEYNRRVQGPLCQPLNSNWPHAQTYDHKVSEAQLPPITIRNTNLPISVKKYISDRNGEIQFPNEGTGEGKDNALYGLYAWPDKDNPTIPIPIDNTNWLNDLSIYKMNFGEAQNRKETDIRDKFVKIRVRYSGEELAVIDFLNTIYTVSYA